MAESEQRVGDSATETLDDNQATETAGSPFPPLDRKKALLDAQRPLSPEVVGKLKEYFDVEWTHHSTAIEGNTLTLQETAAVLKHGVTVKGKSFQEYLEIIDHKKAIDFVESLAQVQRPIGEDDLRRIHALVTEGMDGATPGQYRAIQVRIGGSEYLYSLRRRIPCCETVGRLPAAQESNLPRRAGSTVQLSHNNVVFSTLTSIPPRPEEVPHRMKEFAAWLDQSEVPDMLPVVGATKAHLELVTIHPFVDGNGRTARLLQNLLLMRRGFPPAVIRFDERAEYYQVLEEAHQGKGERRFMDLIAKTVERSLDIYLGAAGVEYDR